MLDRSPANTLPRPSAGGNVEPARRDAMWWVAILIALAELVACVVMPFRVYWSGVSDYEAGLDGFKRWLIVPTLVYFVAGTWAASRTRPRQPA